MFLSLFQQGKDLKLKKRKEKNYVGRVSIPFSAGQRLKDAGDLVGYNDGKISFYPFFSRAKT